MPRTTLLAFAIIVHTAITFAARADDLQPLPSAMRFQLQSVDALPRFNVPAIDPLLVQQLEDKDSIEGLGPRYAIRNAVNITPNNAGTWERPNPHTAVWRLKVTCPNALNINLGFTRYHMPEAGQLFLYTQSQANRDQRSPSLVLPLRSFTHADNAPHQQLWTPPVTGSTLIIEVTLPVSQIKDLQLQLGFINTGFRNFGPISSQPSHLDKQQPTQTISPSAEDLPPSHPPASLASGSCNIDVMCDLAADWHQQIPAVAVISTGGDRFCSGFMVNNVRNDRRPFFITANHCGIDVNTAPSLVVFWNYHNSTCRPPGSPQSGSPGDGSLLQFSTGSILRAAYAPTDITLVELSQPPPPSWQLAWAGWDVTGEQSPFGAIIHHPNGEEKRIAFYNAQTTNSSWPGCSTFGSTHLRTFYNLGTTEIGSSGSPLFDSEKRVIGQLHGGPASCSTSPSNSYDCHGRLFKSWTGGNTNTTRLSNWLDPDGDEPGIIDTIGSGLTITPATNVSHNGPFGGPFTNATTVYTISNTTGNVANYSVDLVPGGTAPVLINGGTSTVYGSLPHGSSINISISLASVANLLPVGVYATTVRFVDVTNEIESFRVHSLQIGQISFAVAPYEGLNGSGPMGGPFSPSGGLTYTITNTGVASAIVRVQGSVDWISINGNPGGGFVDVALPGYGSTANVAVGFSSAANSLGVGLHKAIASFTNVTGGGTGASSDTMRPISLEVGTYVYSSTGGPWPIPDNNQTGVSSVILVPDDYCVADVNVTVNVAHTYVGDLRLVLRHNNVEAAIIDRPGVPTSTFGCSEDNFADATLDDKGTGGPIEVLCTANLTSPPNYTPNEPLSLFDGMSVAGEWRLTVSDHAGQDVGVLNSWSMNVLPLKTACPPVAQDVAISVPILVTSNIALSGSSSTGPLVYVIASVPANGKLYDPLGSQITTTPHTLANGGHIVRYKPEANHAGPDWFTYKVNDGQDSNIASVDILVGGPQLVHDFLLDENPGWATTGPAINGWAFGEPTGNGGDPDSGFTGNNVYGYNLKGTYTHNMAEYSLTTHAINCSNLTGVEVQFRRWLGVEQSSFDHAKFQMSTDSTTWITIWNNPAGPGQSIVESAWSLQSYQLPQGDGQPTVFLRWTMGPTDGSIVYSGWNIDDVQIWGIRPPCLADCTGDWLVNVNDLLLVINSWGSCPLGCIADIAPPGGDGQINVNDLLSIINGWGACP